MCRLRTSRKMYRIREYVLISSKVEAMHAYVHTHVSDVSMYMRTERTGACVSYRRMCLSTMFQNKNHTQKPYTHHLIMNFAPRQINILLCANQYLTFVQINILLLCMYTCLGDMHGHILESHTHTLLTCILRTYF